MTWLTEPTRNDVEAFRRTLPPPLDGQFHVSPRWQIEHLDHLFQLTSRRWPGPTGVETGRALPRAAGAKAPGTDPVP